jgi:hypothetical protein
MRRPYTEEQRIALVREHAESGLGAAAFCRLRGVSAGSLAEWRRRYGAPGQAGAADAAGGWVSLGVGDAPAEAPAGYVLDLARGRLELPRGFHCGEARLLCELLARHHTGGAR